MSKCNHAVKVGDNYGLSCFLCGEQLEGYGNWAEGNGTCIHRFVKEYDENGKETGLEVCIYCEEVRKVIRKDLKNE